MMKIYPQNLVKSIQTIIDSGKVEISTFNSYDEFIPEINSCEIHIKFTKNSKGDRDPIIMINNSNITSQFINSWRTSAPGKFMCKDYRKDKKDFNQLLKRIEVDFVDKERKAKGEIKTKSFTKIYLIE